MVSTVATFDHHAPAALLSLSSLGGAFTRSWEALEHRVATVPVPTELRPERWLGVKKIEPTDEGFQELVEQFEQACGRRQDKYSFGLRVAAIYRVERAESAEGHRDEEPQALEQLAATGAERRRCLFHGTTRDAAKAIIDGGFRLPDRKGMFGKGIYFADCPLKSLQYTRVSEWTKHLPRFVRSRGLMLLCSVDLGTSRHQRWANSSLTGQPGLWTRLTSLGHYDSVIGLATEQGGSLRVPEYVVYDPSRVRVDYIFEVLAVAASEG